MTCLDIIIQIIASFCGTLGFCFLFNIRGKKLLWASIGGMVFWGLFLILGIFIESEAVRYFIVSVCSTIYAEVLARRLKTPTTTFCIITLIPLVPGSGLYYTTTSAFSHNREVFMTKFIDTAELAVALSLGIVLVTSVTRYFINTRNNR